VYHSNRISGCVASDDSIELQDAVANFKQLKNKFK